MDNKTEKDFLELLKSYENKWVAILNGNKIVASGEDAFEAKKEAEAKGIKDFVLFKVFPFNAGYAPYAL